MKPKTGDVHIHWRTYGRYTTTDYHEKDEFKVADFMEGLRFVRGELNFDADYIRGRRIKTHVAVCANQRVVCRGTRRELARRLCPGGNWSTVTDNSGERQN
jgi:hypothetical protein